MGADTTTLLIVGIDSGTAKSVAVRFTTGGNADGYYLRTAHIEVTSVAMGVGNFVVAIHEESGGGVSDTIVGTLSGTNPTASGIHVFDASDITLRGNTNYFLVLSAPDATGSASYILPATVSEESTGSGGWSIQYQQYVKEGSGAFMAVPMSRRNPHFAIVADVIVPANPPRSVRMADRDPMSTELTVTWEMPSGGGTVTHYDVCILAATMEINDTNCTGTAARTSGVGNHREAASASMFTHTRMGLTAEADYNIAVRAIGIGTGNNSDWVPTSLRLKLRVFLESALP